MPLIAHTINLQETLRILITTSRPRFWMYLVGPSILGSIVALTQPQHMLNPVSIGLILFFTFPANIFLYGINDWFDTDTDALNTKKAGYEARLLSKHKLSILKGILFFIACVVGYIVLLPPLARLFLWLFIILSWVYSAPPLRLKSRPFIDAYSNILYVMPFCVTYTALTHQLPGWQPLIIGAAWTTGMHVFSAIPDIIPDRKAGVQTTATFLGAQKALLFVGEHWLLAALLAFKWYGTPGLIGMVYPCIVGLIWYMHKKSPSGSSLMRRVMRWYIVFPAINTVVGFVLFWLIAVS